MASAVEFEPVPAITGTRPAAVSMQSSMTLLVLVMAERRRFARGPARHEPVRALVDLPLDELLERRRIELAVLERGDQGRERAFERGDGQGQLLGRTRALKVNGVTKPGGQ